MVKTKKIKKLSESKANVLIPFVKTLASIKNPDHRCILMSHLDLDSCELIYETIFNVISNKSIPVKKRQQLQKVLQPHQNNLRYMANKNNKATLKKKRLTQIGGNPLGIILSTAIPLLLEAFKK